jgi:spore coat protein A, manganese oxidase
MRLSRRHFLTAGAVTGASLVLPWHLRAQRALAQATPTLDPTTIPKFVTPLVIPPAMPLTARIRRRTIDYYVIAVVQFAQQILPAGLPRTRVWSYQLRNDRGTRNYPAFTIEALADRPVRVNWINGLVDGAGRYLPHVLPVDPTLHWANPPGGVAGRDSRPTFATTPGPYTGPVPIVSHLHGGNSTEEHDGYAEAW